MRMIQKIMLPRFFVFMLIMITSCSVNSQNFVGQGSSVGRSDDFSNGHRASGMRDDSEPVDDCATEPQTKSSEASYFTITNPAPETCRPADRGEGLEGYLTARLRSIQIKTSEGKSVIFAEAGTVAVAAGDVTKVNIVIIQVKQDELLSALVSAAAATTISGEIRGASAPAGDGSFAIRLANLSEDSVIIRVGGRIDDSTVSAVAAEIGVDRWLSAYALGLSDAAFAPLVTQPISDPTPTPAPLQGLTGPCPGNYVYIPADATLGVGAFCVMKYEAKNIAGIATSQPGALPWVNIARGLSATDPGSAWQACENLGPGYDLLSNTQWQSIARNIEGVSANWSHGDSSGDHALNRGHSDFAPASGLAASDSEPCFGTGNDHCTDNTHPDFTQKRTHTLSTGEIIWDIAGNVYEMVQGTDNLVDGAARSQGYGDFASQSPWAQPPYDGSVGTRLEWGPAGDYAAKSSGEHGGLGYADLDGVGGMIIRGGAWNSRNASGIFLTYLGSGHYRASSTFGFRCAGPVQK